MHFKPHLGPTQARLACFLRVVLVVIGQRIVSLVLLARHPHISASGRNGLPALLRRLRASAAAGRTGCSGHGPETADAWIYAMDLANWQFGKTHISILVVSVILGDVGRSIAWRALPTKSAKP